MPDLIWVIILTVISLASGSYIFILNNKVKSLIKSLAQSEIDKLMLKGGPKATEISEDTEGFIRFLSESREWAFSYIESAQRDIQDLKDAVRSADMQRITEAQNKIIKLLPEDTGLEGAK